MDRREGQLPGGTRAVRIILLLAMGLSLSPPAHGQEGESGLGQRISGQLRLSGEHRVDGTVTVDKEGELILEEGCRILFGEGGGINVHGRLQVKGSGDSPVVLAPVGEQRWKGLAFYQGSASEIENLRLKGAHTGLSILAAEMKISGSEVSGCEKGLYLVREARVHVEGVRFFDNQLGLAAEMKSTAMVQGSVFEGNNVGLSIASGARPVITGNRFLANDMAIQVSQRYPETVKGNLFAGNKVAVRLYQNGPDTVIEANLFEDNSEAAIQVLSFSSPVIRNNMIRRGRYGLLANQFSSPSIVNNAFEDLTEAIHLNKKNQSGMSGNIISSSEVGLFLDFSSYPVIRRNIFADNGIHIKLGRFQSSHWEASAGSKQYVMRAAARVSSRNPKLVEGPEVFPESVDASGNHWDRKTRGEMGKKGPDANINSLFDGHDLPEVTYEGFGEQKYRLDRIIYSPFLESPPADAGLRDWKGKVDELRIR